MRVQRCPIKYHTAIKTQSYTGIGQRREVEVRGLEDVVSQCNSEDKLLLVDDVFDTGNSVKAVLEQFKSQARKNCPGLQPHTLRPSAGGSPSSSVRQRSGRRACGTSQPRIRPMLCQTTGCERRRLGLFSLMRLPVYRKKMQKEK